MHLDSPVTLANWMEPPWNRSAFCAVREVVPTARIARPDTSPSVFATASVELDDVTFTAADGAPTTWAASAAATFCDAVCVVHRGRIVHERYHGALRDDQPHLLMSVSKSFCGALLGISIDRGLLAIDDLVCDIAPQFAGTSLDGATLRHLVDMTAGTDFSEDYDQYTAADGDHVLIDYERHAGYRPLGGRTPVGTIGHFATYGTAYPHGAWFQYRSPLTNVIARVLEIVHGCRYADLVARELWAPLRQEHDGDIMLDPLGNPVVEGGMSCTVRDLARFGVMMLDGRTLEGEQLLSPAWIDDTWIGDEAALKAFHAAPTHDPEARDWTMYRNAFWVMKRGVVASGLGIFGQYCWMHRPTSTVIARFSTYPSALPIDLSGEVLRGFDAVAAYLAGTG